MVTGSVLIFQKANFDNFISRKVVIIIKFISHFNLAENFLAQYPIQTFYISLQLPINYKSKGKM